MNYGKSIIVSEPQFIYIKNVVCYMAFQVPQSTFFSKEETQPNNKKAYREVVAPKTKIFRVDVSELLKSY
jgi:hypothetical protein